MTRMPCLCTLYDVFGRSRRLESALLEEILNEIIVRLRGALPPSRLPLNVFSVRFFQGDLVEFEGNSSSTRVSNRRWNVWVY